MPAQHQQVVRVVGPGLAEGHGHHRLAGEVDDAVVKGLPLIGAGQGPRARVDREIDLRFAVAAIRVGRLSVLPRRPVNGTSS